MLNAKSTGAPNYEARTTLQTYYKIVAWQPHRVMKYMGDAPVMMVVPEMNKINPPAKQFALFESFKGRLNKVHVAQSNGHLNEFSGDDFPVLWKDPNFRICH